MSRHSESIGIGNLPNQVHRKSVKKGFEFTLMTVGESGLGKSTLVNALFKTRICSSKSVSNNNNNITNNNHNNTVNNNNAKNNDQNSFNSAANLTTTFDSENSNDSTVKMVTHQADIEDRGVKLKLSVVSADGFGDSLDSTDNIEPIVRYVDRQYERFFEHERGINRKQIIDTRVHCCLYFLPPDSWRLRPIDLYFLNALHTKMNIIILISKADTLTIDERTAIKEAIRAEIQEHKLQIYSIPDDYSDDDPDYRDAMTSIKNAMPLAISASNTHVEEGGKKVLVRQYPWGTHEVENQKHSDFVKLQTLIVTHMQDLREITHEIHYENYRAARLVGEAANSTIYSNCSGSLYGGVPGKGASLGTVIETSIDDDYDSITSCTELEKERLLREKEAEIRKMAEKLRLYEEQMQRMQQQTSNNQQQQNNGQF